MSEALKLVAESPVSKESSTDAFLKDVGWTFAPQARRIKSKNGARVDKFRIAELDSLDLPQRIIATAHYALEFSDPRLKSVNEAVKQLDAVEAHAGNGTALFNRQGVVDDFLLAAAVEEKLIDAYDEYSQYSIHDDEYLRGVSADYSADNLDSLNMLRRLRESSKPEKSIPMVVGRAAESVLRLAIAKEKGLFEQYEQKSVWSRGNKKTLK